MNRQINRPFLSLLFFTALTAMLLTSCSGTNTDSPIYDPFEKYNRHSLKMNDALDKAVLLPIAKGYRAVTPEAGRMVIRNFLRNLNSPVIIGNELLQGDLKGAHDASIRMVVNTLAGFGGILDLASDGGFEYQPEDFGQTLATWGVGDGLYIMIPLLGPSTLRDTAGRFVDSYADPLRTYLFNIEEGHLQYSRTGMEVLSGREELIEVIDDLRKNSFDYYAAVRSAYYQRRQAQIHESGGEMMEIPDYDEFEDE